MSWSDSLGAAAIKVIPSTNFAKMAGNTPPGTCKSERQAATPEWSVVHSHVGNSAPDVRTRAVSAGGPSHDCHKLGLGDSRDRRPGIDVRRNRSISADFGAACGVAGRSF